MTHNPSLAELAAKYPALHDAKSAYDAAFTAYMNDENNSAKYYNLAPLREKLRKAHEAAFKAERAARKLGAA